MRGIAITLVALGGCGHPAQTGDFYVDACLRWTACASLPSGLGGGLAFCMDELRASAEGGTLLWSPENVPATVAQLRCIAAAGLDCDRVMNCLSAAATTACARTASCSGDTRVRCELLRGDRLVTQDCAATGLRCVPVGDQAFCGLATCANPNFQRSCMGNLAVRCDPVVDANNQVIGGVLGVADDCTARAATCSNGECVGNGASCTPGSASGGFACDGNTLLFCDVSRRTERIDCATLGLLCLKIDPNNVGDAFDCALSSHICPPVDGACNGTKLSYCDELGNTQTLDCKALGYRGCSDGRCVSL